MDKINFLEFACGRYSCRELTGASVAAGKLERILEAARIAPIAHNKQPFRVFPLEGPETVGKAHEITPCILGTDCFLMVAVIPGEAWVREFDQTNFATADASIVATHTMLTIEAEGLNATWVGYFDTSRAKELFSVTAPCELIMLFPTEEKATKACPAHLHEKRRPTADLVERF